uniref:Reverse transcriptase domain-containing protein n=1 Tax=Amphimedon queenslandica TaxID=400682 RepID=A0A1X7U925_AMPQE
WYADDASACAGLEALKDWLLRLLKEGPKFGYSPKPSKSYVVVNERSIERARILFSPLGVNVVTSHRFLGGVVGDREGQTGFIKSRVEKWSHILNRLAEIAVEQPQAAYAALTKSIQNKWQFTQRLIPNCQQALTDIEHLLANSILPAIFGCEISHPGEKCLLSSYSFWPSSCPQSDRDL